VELVFQASRSGPPCCRAGATSLHSSYDPEREADRYLDGAAGGRSPSCFILSGPCLDYLSPAIRKRFGEALIVSIQHDARFGEYAGPLPSGRGADAVWYPGSALSREAFLEACLPEEALGGIAFLEWQPAAQAYPEEAELTREAVKSTLDRLASSNATLKAFGRLWIRNACRNVLLVDTILTPPDHPVTDRPVVVAAAGPSLVDGLDVLRPFRQRFLLFAVSSALAACRGAGFEPDFVVASDGSYWSRLHLYPLGTRGANLAMPLTAAPLPSVGTALPFLALVQGNFPEPELAPLVGGGLPLPGHGTVSGTALHLAARLSSGPIIVAGMDLASRDIVSHARPHGFDTVTREFQSRLGPLEGLVRDREAPLSPLALPERPWRTSRSLSVYAAALAQEARLPPFAGRLWRIAPSPVALPGYAILEPSRGAVEAFFGRLPGGEGTEQGLSLRQGGALPLPDRKEALLACIEGWKGLASEAASGLAAGVLPRSGRAAEFLKAVDLPWWAAACRAVVSGRDAGPAARELESLARGFADELEERLL
jgi:hypothetical protein